MKITINEPCHENWDNMTPNQQGAFCKSCMKDVVDFSKKSIEEIKTFFSEPKGNVCGRFKESQMQELSFDDFFSRFKYWNFSKKFATIFILAFGFWIFSTTSLSAQEEPLMGKVAYIPHKEVVKDTVKRDGPVKTKVDGSKKIKGRVAVTKTVCEKMPKTIKETPVLVKQEQMLMGSVVAYNPAIEQQPAIKTVELIEPEVKTVEVIKYVDLVEEKQELVIIQTVRKQPEIKVLEAKNISPEIAVSENKILVYPNPSSGTFIVETPEKQILRVYDLTGRMVMSQNVTGLTKIDAGQLENGTYSLVFTGPKNSVTRKLIITR